MVTMLTSIFFAERAASDRRSGSRSSRAPITSSRAAAAAAAGGRNSSSRLQRSCALLLTLLATAISLPTFWDAWRPARPADEALPPAEKDGGPAAAAPLEALPLVCSPGQFSVPWAEFQEEPGVLTSAIFTPYDISPGGGEKYLLSVAQVLQAMGYTITIYVLPNNVCQSKAALLSTAEALRVALDPGRLQLQAWPPPGLFLQGSGGGLAALASQPGELVTAVPPRPRFFFVLGNEKVPQVPGIGSLNIFMCQFPFDLDSPVSRADMLRLAGFDYVLLNSAFSYKWYNRFAEPILRQLQADAGLFPLLEVVRPAVTLLTPAPPDSPMRKHILLLGRFFSGRQSKGHLAALEMYQELRPRLPPGTKLLLVGQLMTGHEAYLTSLQRWVMERGLSQVVDIVVSAPAEVVLGYLHVAIVQWHLTGLGVDPETDPASLEHFGISIVEGMSAGCIPIALAIGGPADIIEHGLNGFLSNNSSAFLDYTSQIFAMPAAEHLAMWQAAQDRAAAFSYPSFEKHFSRVVQRGFQTRISRFFIAATLPILRACASSDVVDAKTHYAQPRLSAAVQVGIAAAGRVGGARWGEPAGQLRPARHALAIIEGRNHFALEYVILNVVGMLAGAGPWALHLFHTKTNAALAARVASSPQLSGRVRLYNLELDELDVAGYNSLLKMPLFWQCLAVGGADRVLLFQTDALLVHPNIAPFLRFDYVGAPWHHQNERWAAIQEAVPDGVGNGGLSIRSIRAMQDIAGQRGQASGVEEQEDFFFASNVAREGSGLVLAPRLAAAAFCLEVPCDDIEQAVQRASNASGVKEGWQAGIDLPFAVHAPWYYNPTTRVMRLLDASLQHVLAVAAQQL